MCLYARAQTRCVVAAAVWTARTASCAFGAVPEPLLGLPETLDSRGLMGGVCLHLMIRAKAQASYLSGGSPGNGRKTSDFTVSVFIVQ